MAFGSEALFDNHLNIAHFLKIIAYFVPFVGLILDYIYTYHKQRLVTEQLEETQEDLAQQTLQLETINSTLEDELAERTQMEEALKQTLTESETTRAELEAFNRSAVNREMRMIELKEQVNNLLTAQGEAPIYQTDTIEEAATHG